MMFITKIIGKSFQNKQIGCVTFFLKFRLFTFFRIQCLSDLAQLQGGNGSGGGQLPVHLASRPSTKRDSRQKIVKDGEDPQTEQLLLEKDEEIRRMQAMIQQMQSQLNQSASSGGGGPSFMDDSTTV